MQNNAKKLAEIAKKKKKKSGMFSCRKLGSFLKKLFTENLKTEK